MSSFDFDLFVIGGGSAGVRTARVAASLGKKVGIAEEYRFGGTCVIRGCVPKKLLVYASQFSESFEDAAGFGWSVDSTSFDWQKLIANKDREIERLEGLYRKGLENAEAQQFADRAVLEGNHKIRLVNEGRSVTAERIVVAVGGAPFLDPALKGAELAITSNEVFHLDEQPAEIVIAGGGYIAVEFACIFAGLGTKTTLVYRGEQILRGFDDDVRNLLHEEMTQKGIRVVCGRVFSSIARQDDGKRLVELDDGETLVCDQVLMATGRKPVTDNLGLEAAGVETDQGGAIKVDAHSRTNVDHIWALGDVTNRVNLTPVAIHEAMCFIETEYKNNPTAPDHELIPTAVFSQPEIGTLGLSEKDASKRFEKVSVFRAHFRPMMHTLSGRNEKMLMKVIVDGQSDRVIGLHIMGHGAGEMIQSLGIAIKMGATKADFDRTMAVHPTAAEELVTMYQPSYVIENGERV